MPNKVDTLYGRIENSGATNRYILKYSDLTIIQDYFMSATFLQNIELLFADASEYVIRCMLYPFDIKQFLTLGVDYFLEDIILGNNIHVVVGGSNYKAYKIEMFHTPLCHLGTVATYTFNKQFNSFLDYEPYTKIQIYLPYADIHTLDVNLYMGKTINIKCDVDLATGDGLYYLIEVVSGVETNVLDTIPAKFGIEIPLGQTNASDVARNHLLNVMSIGAQALGIASASVYRGGFKKGSGNLATATALQGGQLAIQSGINFINANRQHFVKQPTQDGVLDFYKPQSIYLIISRPNVVYPTSYNHFYGKPSGKYKQLNTLTGYTQIADCHLEGFASATQNELNEIETLLKDGVIL